jgi:hypothetical protein
MNVIHSHFLQDVILIRSSFEQMLFSKPMNYSENLQYNQIEVQRRSTYIHWWKLQNFFPMNSTFQLNLHQHIYMLVKM